MEMVVIGGVPGAGKSTALLRYAGTPGVHVLDPDPIRARLRWRPAVHVVHQALVWTTALLGPRVLRVLTRGRALLVHDTATRAHRREAFLRLARRRGWSVALVLIDVPREAALAGQAARGRLVDSGEFDRHWQRWERMRGDLGQVGVDGGEPVLVTRAQVYGVLCSLVGRPRVHSLTGEPGSLSRPTDLSAIAA